MKKTELPTFDPGFPDIDEDRPNPFDYALFWATVMFMFLVGLGGGMAGGLLAGYFYAY